MIRMSVLALCVSCFVQGATTPLWPQADLHLTEREVLETHGLSVLLFHNSYHPVFGDQKMSGLEMILQDRRIATNGDVRLSSEHTLHALDYVLGRRPPSNVSYVSGVGTQSKLIAYGNNRADHAFIPGGIIPGVVILQPDFPELKEGWPFLWYDKEYVVDGVTSYVLAANAAHAETKSAK